MNGIPHLLTTKEQLLIRLGQASYGPTTGPLARRTACVRATALALGMLAVPADVAGTTATVCLDLPAINLTMNREATEIRKLGQVATQFTVGETTAALAILREMDILHATAQTLDGHRLDRVSCRALVPRIDPGLDGWPDTGQTESPTYRIDDQEAA